MASDRLAGWFRVTVAGRIYQNGADPSEPGQPISLTIEHRDQEASRLTLVVKDFDLDSDAPFRELNSVPNPRLVEAIPVLAWIGWDEENPVKAFEGVLAASKMNYQASATEFVALHEAIMLRKRGKVDTLKNMTLADMLRKKAAEEGLVLIIDSSIAGDAALNMPFETLLQNGVANWDFMKRWIVSFGYTTTTIRKNQIVLRRDKSSGDSFAFRRGDENIVQLRVRMEQKRDERSGRRTGHAHENKPGQRWSKFFPESRDTSRNVAPVHPAVGKRADRQHKVPPAREAIRGKAKKRRIEGDELNLTVRLQPEMKNVEKVVISDFGPNIDGTYHTSSVTHRLGNQPATTEIEAWRP
jgi:hypothetical protein